MCQLVFSPLYVHAYSNVSPCDLLAMTIERAQWSLHQCRLTPVMLKQASVFPQQAAA